MKRLAFILFGICFSGTVVAAEYALPMLYSRAEIFIARHDASAMPEPALPWQNGAAAAPPKLSLQVEVRDAAILYRQEGWFSLSSPAEKTGTLLMLPTPDLMPIPPTMQYAPIDILMIDKEGKITQIIPQVIPAEIEEEIYPDSPVLAFLFLKGGECGKLSVKPGDMVEYELFKKPPAILTAPEPAPRASPATPAPAKKP